MTENKKALLRSIRIFVKVIITFNFSMGGAIAVHIGVQELISTLRGVAVIDVVEGKNAIIFVHPKAWDINDI